MHHTCADSCFDARTAKKSTVICFLCLKKCNAKCYKITDTVVIKALASDSNDDSHALLFCSKCKDRIVKMRPKSNRQSDVSARRLSAPSLDKSPELGVAGVLNSSSNVSNQDISPQLTNFFEMITGKLDKIIENGKAQPNTATDDASLISENKNTLDNIFKLLMKTLDTVSKLHTIENEKDSILKITTLLNKITVNLSSPSIPKRQNNLHDWSLNDISINNQSDESSGRPSLMIKQSVDDDILKILRHSDETTWFTLDRIIKNQNEHGAKLDSLLSHREPHQESQSIVPQNTQDSALINAINGDMIHTIRDKCDNIESKINALFEDIASIKVQYDDSNTPVIAPSSSSSLTEVCIEISESFDENSPSGKPTAMSKHEKEAMTHKKTAEFVPETFENDVQKRLSPNLSGSRLSSGSNYDTACILDDEESALEALNLLDSDSVTIPAKPTRRHELYVRNFSNDTTSTLIENYIKRRGVNTDESYMKIYPLIPRDKDPSTLSFISFKIDADDCIATAIRAPSFWPEGSTISPWEHRKRDQHFLDRRLPPAKMG